MDSVSGNEQLECNRRIEAANELLRVVVDHCPDVLHKDAGRNLQFLITSKGIACFHNLTTGEISDDIRKISEESGVVRHHAGTSLMLRLIEYVRYNTPVPLIRFNPMPETRDALNLVVNCKDIDALRRKLVNSPALNIDGKSAAHPFANLKALLPKIEKAQQVFDDAFRKADTDDQLAAACTKFNVTLKKALDAACKDTAQANSRSTLEQVYSPHGRYCTYFNMNGSTYDFLKGVVMSCSFNRNIHEAYAADLAEWERVAAEVDQEPAPVMAM